jgi:hypothetical protein
MLHCVAGLIAVAMADLPMLTTPRGNEADSLSRARYGVTMMISLKTLTESRFSHEAASCGLRHRRPGELFETGLIVVLAAVLIAAWAIAVGI